LTKKVNVAAFIPDLAPQSIQRMAPVRCLAYDYAEYAKYMQTRMWANAQCDGRPAEHRWRPLFNAAKFG